MVSQHLSCDEDRDLELSVLCVWCCLYNNVLIIFLLMQCDSTIFCAALYSIGKN